MGIVNLDRKVGSDSSVRRYSRASTAIMALILITLVTSTLIGISRKIDYSGEINYVEQYLGLWKLIAGVATGFLSWYVVSMTLRLWQERYQLHVSKVITVAAITGLVVGIFSSTLYDGLLWFKWYVAIPVRLFDLNDTLQRDAFFLSMPSLLRVATMIVGTALITLAVQGWKQRKPISKSGFPRVLIALLSAFGALLIVDSIVGLRFIPIDSYYIDRYYNPLVGVSMNTLLLILSSYLFFAFRAKVT